MSGTSAVGIRIDRCRRCRADGVELEQVVLELRQLAGAAQRRRRVRPARRPHLGVAVLAGVQVEHEVDERARQPRRRAAQDGEARAGDLARRRSKSRMPSCSPSSQCGFGAKSNVGFVAPARGARLSASLVPSGTLACGAFGIASRRCSDSSSSFAELGLAFLDLGRQRLQLVARGRELRPTSCRASPSDSLAALRCWRIVSSSPWSLRRRSSRSLPRRHRVATSPPRRRTSSIRAGSSMGYLWFLVAKGQRSKGLGGGTLAEPRAGWQAVVVDPRSSTRGADEVFRGRGGVVEAMRVTRKGEHASCPDTAASRQSRRARVMMLPG